MSNDFSLTEDNDRYKYVYPNPISATERFRELISDLENYPGNVDISALYGETKNFIEEVVEPRLSDEALDKYKVRVFADVIEQSDSEDYSIPNRAHSNLEMMTYAKYAAESGDVETAKSWYLRMIAYTDRMDSTYWALYSTFCVRVRDLNLALVCARKAVSLDGQNRLALFVHVAVLMTTDHTGLSDEMQTVLASLESTQPQFSEAHMLFALHYHRIDMPDYVARFLATASLFVNDYDGVPTEFAKVSGELVIDHCGDPIIKCIVLLIGLNLARLAVEFLQCFSAQFESVTYHYLMALSLHLLGKNEACTDHLNSISHESKWAGRRTLLEAHNDFDAGRTQKAVTLYFRLCSRQTRARYILAYTRTADYLAAHAKFAEATDAYHRACTIIRMPVLLTKLGECLVALQHYPEAEKVLADAVAEDGVENGRPWHHMAVLYSKTGQIDAADVCRRQASRLGFKSPMSLN